MKVAVFEGPKIGTQALHGWRHYQVRMQTGAVRPFLCMPSKALGVARQLGAEFFAAGTWEDETGHGSHPVHFPAPRREILEKLSGVARAPLSLSMRHNSDGEIQKHNP